MTKQEKTVRRNGKLLAELKKQTGLSGATLFFALKLGIIGIIETPKKKQQKNTKLSPEQKAKELVGKFMQHANWGKMEDEEFQRNEAKACALIAVDEILAENDIIHHKTDPYNSDTMTDLDERDHYWQKVKTEIQSL